jgi:prefoldin alpha subunit
VSEKELQEKVMMYRIIESRLDALIRQRDLFLNKIAEMQNTLASIEEIEKTNEEILFPIGSEAYAPGKVVDKNKIIVEVGAGIVIEKNFAEAKETILKRSDDIEEAVIEIQQDVQKLDMSLNVLEPEIRDLMQKGKSEAEAG